MIIAGPCLYVDKNDEEMVWQTARALSEIPEVTHFRCKLWGGGTRVDRYCEGIGIDGFNMLEDINNSLFPVGTEVQSLAHIGHATMRGLDFIWIGARNSQNYDLLQHLNFWDGMVLIKRSPAMTIDEVIGLYDICKKIYQIRDVYIIERGINTFDRLESSRWSPDLKGVIRIKNERRDIFSRLVVDCSHSVGDRRWIHDTYTAFKSIGVEHFMFECTHDGVSRTDQNHMLNTDELREIIK